jgi:glycosyltransferase involved in cell wall biosynthesis
MERNKYMVCVRCLTYNHSAFIEDAMNGFCMQQTNFPFVCIIVDDASTDGEQELIIDYLNNNFDLADRNIFREEETNDFKLVFSRHKSNKNCYFAVLFLKYNHYRRRKAKRPYYNEWLCNSKYSAICEGDDYWIDASKLQIQVSFLESHPDYSMCFHSAEIVNMLKVQSYLSGIVDDRDYTANELFENWIVPTASIVARIDTVYKVLKGGDRILNGDIVIVLTCCSLGKVRGISKKMSAYRISESGVTYTKVYRLDRIRRYPEHFNFIKDNFSEIINKQLLNKQLVRYLYLRSFSYPSLDYRRYLDFLRIILIDPLYFFKNIITRLYWIIFIKK